MSFFSSGFSSIVRKNMARRSLKEEAQKKKTGATEEENKKGDADGEDSKKKDEWQVLLDAYGRPYWQHTVTGQWTYGGCILPGEAVNSPYVVNPTYTTSPGHHVLQPTAAPWGGMAPMSSMQYPVPMQSGEYMLEQGQWEARYDANGRKCWEHTGTKEVTYACPFY